MCLVFLCLIGNSLPEGKGWFSSSRESVGVPSDVGVVGGVEIRHSVHTHEGICLAGVEYI